MKLNRTVTFVLAGMLLFCLAGYAPAQETENTKQEAASDAGGAEDAMTKGFQLSLFNPWQIHKPDVSIKGFRWNFLYGTNANVSGLDMGAANVATGDVEGLQFGIYNEAGNTAKGAQLGVMNTAQESEGLMQLGVFNHVTNMKGYQFGLIYNSADTLDGVQIGLLNFVWSRESMTFFPLVNVSF